ISNLHSLPTRRSSDLFPKRTVTIRDSAAYGLILTQGHGTLGKLAVSTPAMIRFGQMTEDELFVTAEAARQGVRIQNPSETDPLRSEEHTSELQSLAYL